MSILKLSLRFRNKSNKYVTLLKSMYKSQNSSISSFSHLNSKSVTVKYTESAIDAIYDVEQNDYSRLLSSYGFKVGQIKRILHPMNDITSVEADDMAENLAHWHTFKMPNVNRMLSTLSAFPELLTLNPLYVQQRTEELMTLFTQSDISKLLVTCPKVFLDEFETVKEKVEYIVNFMGVEQDSIVKSEALQFDMSHIKLRYTFVKYLGVYKVYKKERNRNPPLSKVFSTNLNKLLNLSMVTKEEFTVFCDCYENIEDELENNDEETDSEEEYSDTEE